jgi:hypothetical protein
MQTDFYHGLLEPRRILEEQQKVATAITRDTKAIARHVFCYTKGQKAGKASHALSTQGG